MPMLKADILSCLQLALFLRPRLARAELRHRLYKSRSRHHLLPLVSSRLVSPISSRLVSPMRIWAQLPGLCGNMQHAVDSQL